MNRKEFEKKLIDKDLSNKDVIEYLGISSCAYYRKLKTTSEFTQEEIKKMIKFLNLTSDESMTIFFS